ncbi:NitT/TauT family transport system ATP-binding protein [Enterovirga rhinocerotis]|uniref:NitT/TauT family transport system ATP-binding protein n=1 Tax=Enterovirga rhinocerotis TaxID=1339210 RepID=A0A4R7C6U8_9HYPH|nr:ABC transporter ATP-binding protein [Enterovirga rhinocerotis]TDR92965.1 NitT/TauT family transport system ATP-binding protein [Enterovirga rhinocerotis]
MTAPLLSAEGLSLRYPDAARPVFAGIDLEIEAGEIVTILGPSGAGKSSLLRVLGGLQAPTGGSVSVGGAPLRGAHPRVAFAFQSPGLLPWLTLERNVAFGLDFRRQPRLAPGEMTARIDAAIAEVGLDHARHLRPAALSGGMAQRAALAWCLARKPEALLLDEPFGALDEVTRGEMQELILKVVADLGTAIVLVTHDIDEALLVSDRIILLGGSPAAPIGAWPVALPHPRHDLIAELGALRIDILTTMRGLRSRRRELDHAV